MKPIMAICVIGDTGEVIQTEDSGGNVHESTEEIEKVVWRARGAAREMGEVLRDVVVAA
jgi:hypothetical protein